MKLRTVQRAMLAGCMLAGLTAAATQPAAAEDKKYTIYLSNSVIGNDWLQQMIRSAEVSVTKGPLAGRVDLHVETVENTTQAQINSLNNIIAAKPDAIIVHAGSVSALDPTLERACAAGIVVVSFSQVVTADCPYKVNTNWAHLNHDLPTWLATVLGGKGKVIVDRGLPGSPISEAATKEFEKVLGYLPRHRDRRLLDLQLRARRRAGRRREPAGRKPRDRRHPDRRLRHRRHPGAQGCRPAARADRHVRLQRLGDRLRHGAGPEVPRLHPSALSVGGRDQAGRRRARRQAAGQQADRERLSAADHRPRQSAISQPGAVFEKIEVGKNVFPDLPPGLVLPASPSWIDITPAGSQRRQLVPVALTGPRSAAGSGRDQQALRRDRRPQGHAFRRVRPAKCTRYSARTAPERARSSRS